MSLAGNVDLLAARIRDKFNTEAAKRYPGLTVALIGASMTFNNSNRAGIYDAASGDPTFYSFGYFGWANVFLGHRLRLIYNAGVGGAVVGDMATQATAVTNLAVRPGICIVGPDSFSNSTVAAATSTTTIAGLTTAVNTLINAGIHVVLCTNVKRTDVNTGTEKQYLYETNAWIREQASRLGITVIDMCSISSDPVTGDVKSGITQDGVHPNTLGAMMYGRVLADGMATLARGSRDLISDNADTRLVTTNPTFNGTSGTVGSGVTGQAATGWTLTYSGTAATAVGSVVARTDEVGGNWQQIKHTSTSSGTLWLLNTASSGFSVGDIVRGECEFETDDDWNTSFKQLWLYVVWTGGSGNATDMYNTEATPPSMQNPVDGVLTTPKITIPSGTTAATIVVVTQGSAGTVRIGRCSIRKV